MKFDFAHFNFNVLNLSVSLDFYDKAIGLKEKRRIAGDGFTIVYLTDGNTPFELELTELNNRKDRYDLGECEFHLALETDDYDASYEKHKNMGCICYENKAMGIYFIEDPDGYWIEIIRKK